MKILKNIFLITLMSFIGFGCEDFFETVPTDRISNDIFWKTEKDAVLGANAVYTHILETTTLAAAASHYASWDGITDIGYTNLPQSPESCNMESEINSRKSRGSND